MRLEAARFGCVTIVRVGERQRLPVMGRTPVRISALPSGSSSVVSRAPTDESKESQETSNIRLIYAD
jgi:hypothetical protein